jgi:hypothetical protein
MRNLYWPNAYRLKIYDAEFLNQRKITSVIVTCANLYKRENAHFKYVLHTQVPGEEAYVCDKSPLKAFMTLNLWRHYSECTKRKIHSVFATGVHIT